MAEEINGIFTEVTVAGYKIERCDIKVWFDMDQTSYFELLVNAYPEELYSDLEVGAPILLNAGYRQGDSFEFAGKVSYFRILPCGLLIHGHGPEQSLFDTRITESYTDETSKNIVAKVLQTVGLQVNKVDLPNETFEHIIFSNMTGYACLCSLHRSLEAQYGHDLRNFYFWNSDRGFCYTDGNLGTTWVLDDSNIILHSAGHPDGVPSVQCAFNPNIKLGQLVHIMDKAIGFDATRRVLGVSHCLNAKKARTFVTYEEN